MSTNRVFRSARMVVLLSSAAIVLSFGMPGPTRSSEPAANPAQTKGFVVTYFWYATYEGDNDCPDGPAIGMRRLAFPKLSKLPESERKRLLDPANGEDLQMTLQALALGGVAYQGATVVTQYLVGPKLGNEKSPDPARNPKGVVDQCLYPTAFDDPPLKTAQGRVGYGMNLDGVDWSKGQSSQTSCPHDEFVSPTGEVGIDNQMQRVLGCIDGFRHKASYSPATTEEWAQGSRRDGETTILLEVRGVTDERNSKDVEVAIYDSLESTPYDSQAHGLNNYSLTATDVVPGERDVAHGRIVDGVLTTDPTDLVIPRRGQPGSFPYRIQGARLRLEFQPDGSVKGILAGYFSIAEAYKAEVGSKGRFAAASMAQIDLNCPSFYAALNKMADGYRDPKTGRCTALSTAFRVEAVPAFVIHPPAAQAKAGEAAPVTTVGR
ncbi:MAG TPA: hypothetical protein VKZ79_06140 [Alphaproteobacteria bacterium]|nr:hypothetical protein [Alphaproteobacteria bacterium]